MPKSHKTLFRRYSPLKYKVVPFNPNDVNDKSKFVYFGLKETLKKIINPTLQLDNLVYLTFNVDGVSSFKSSCLEIWPILAHIHTNRIDHKPFPVCMRVGKGKPKSLNLFFNDFIDELNELIVGFEMDEEHCFL